MTAPANKPLAGKIALVTGASRGIGRSIATRLAHDGAMVAVHYVNSEGPAKALVAEITSAGGSAFAVKSDLASHGGVATLFTAFDAELVSRTGVSRFDILVNNAGIAPMHGLNETTEAIMDEIYAVNVKAPFFISQEAARRLNDGGRIVNLSSVVVRLPFPSALAYSVLKAPIDTLTRGLAVELGARSITVNAISPGVIETDMTSFVKSQEGLDFTLGQQALKRLGQPADIADVVAFLAGPDSRWVTGQVLEVSGGSVLSF
ncbi:MAG: SDR family oxidoreductase [Hyphomicrobiaceae bacterium]|nr:SDR family oxidoreductase [Hyphomicrobiaceae bacterium]